MQPGQYIHVPAGSLHAFCQGAIAVAFSTNADITYRLYDFDRIDPKTGKERELHIQQVFDNIRIPDDTLNAFWPEKTKAEGCEITRFYDEKTFTPPVGSRLQSKVSLKRKRLCFMSVPTAAGE